MTTIQLRHGTAAEWAANNPILKAAEKGIEVDTSLEKNGNGVDPWNDLPYTGIGSLANVKGFINHGSAAGTLRPVGFGSVEWEGSVRPDNMLPWDTWVDTS